MKQNHLLIGLLTLAILLSACAPASTSVPATVPSTLTSVPTTEAGLSSTPTLQTVAVDTTPTIGSTLPWFDTSTLVYVPVGEFSMGADDPTGQDFNPAHVVTLDAFWIYSTKVTREMYNLCVSVGQCTPSASDSTKPATTLSGTSIFLSVSDPNDSSLKDFPVTDVTWDQASAYCQWAGGHLPTEAEWEKTARGTANQAYPWGDASPSCDLLNFGDCGGFVSGVLDHPNGMSEYKAFDMAGNAYEWVGDWYQADYYAQSPSTNPTGPETGTMRLVRGSSFESNADSVQAFQRNSLAPDQHKVDLGFRCVIPDPTIFAPMCSAPAQVVGNTSTAPQAGQPASVNAGSSSNAISFDSSLVPVTITTYCANPSAKIGGATVTWDWTALLNFASVHCTSFTYGMVADDPKVQIYGIKSPQISGATYTNYVGGPEGATFKLIPGLFDCKLKQTPNPLSQSIPATCATGYMLQTNGMCAYAGTSGQANSIACPMGYSYNQQAQCCTVNPAQTGNAPFQYPACGPGNMFDVQQQVCYKQSTDNQTFIPTSKTYTITLGTCTDEKPKDTDKPKKPQQPPPPTPCVIDPATGACH